MKRYLDQNGHLKPKWQRYFNKNWADKIIWLSSDKQVVVDTIEGFKKEEMPTRKEMALIIQKKLEPVRRDGEQTIRTIPSITAQIRNYLTDSVSYKKKINY